MDCLRAVFRIALFIFVISVPQVSGEEKPHEKVSYFDLPGQALQISLVEFGLQARVTIVADNELLRGQRSSPVIGPLSVEAALRSLLSTTQLAYRYDPTNKIYIIEKSVVVEPVENSITPEEITPELPAVEELLVKSIRLPFRYQTITNSQMLGDVPYFDSSRFINTLPDVLIDDLHPKEMGELLKYASSVTLGHGLGDSNDDFYIRGFRRHALYVDGYRSSDLTGLKLIPANIERVEILKGPSTLLYGQAEPGGIVNAVRKKPRDERFINTELGVGSYGRQYLSVDANSPVIDDALDMRVVVFNET
jgi:iron complex outermembrane receptor protein